MSNDTNVLESAVTILTRRWTPMRPHRKQALVARTKARFTMIPAGRRSGKTEIIGKRKMVLRCLYAHDPRSQFFRPYPNPNFIIAAPTYDQVRHIYWEDIKRLAPPQLLHGEPNNSSLSLFFANGAKLQLMGMDKPERAEGNPIDHIVLDEFANMKPTVWPQHIRPALADRQGGCDFVGVPEGRNHYYDLCKEAQAIQVDAIARGVQPEWEYYTWFSADILPPEEVEAARRDLDEITFRQEMEGSFESFSGRAYYPFNDQIHAAKVLNYNPEAPIAFCFDFNVDPGVATVIQEQRLPNGEDGSGVIGEVYIQRNSNTILVTRKLIEDWRHHQGRIFVYGDATGGSRKSSGVLGSDWELVKQVLLSHFSAQKIFFKVPLANPPERDRINSVNSRLQSLNGIVRLMVDPVRAPRTVKDFEGTVLIPGGSGVIDKGYSHELSHLCFSGDTIVRTDYGKFRFDSIPTNGMVEGPLGTFVEYKEAGRTIENAPIVEVLLSNGERIKCTPWHQILTTSGWMEAQSCLGRKVVSNQLLSKAMELNHSVGIAIGLMGNISQSRLAGGSILPCGNITMERFRRDIAYITKMAIEATITSKTSYQCGAASILQCIRNHFRRILNERNLNALDQQERRLPNGIEAKMGLRGIQNTLLKSGLELRSHSSILVNGAVKSFTLLEKFAANFAQEDVIQKAAIIARSIMRALPALCVERNSKKINMLYNALARASAAASSVVAIRNLPPEDVFCLKVPNEGCFSLANGIVVSNSDSVGYYIYREFPVKPHYVPSGQRYWK